MKNRVFTFEDLKIYAKFKGYDLGFHRYRGVFTLTNLSNEEEWGWVYFPHADQTVAKINDLNLEGWKLAIDHSIALVNK